MHKLELKKIVHSKTDNTVKYIFYTHQKSNVIEFSYINKNDGKDIICVPCQTMCTVGCKFCHTTEYISKIPTRNLHEDEIFNGVEYMYNDLKLGDNPKTLLVSYMGCGEPIINIDGVVMSMVKIQQYYKDIYVRFAMATSLPDQHFDKFFKLTKYIKNFKLPVKLHLSLHYTDDEVRKEWMPKAINIKSTIAAGDFYKSYTDNPVEIHYALIDGVNDTIKDVSKLSDLIKDKDFNVKFLFYNEKTSLGLHPSEIEQFEMFRRNFEMDGIDCEYYKPPGLDIGASCGQFLMDEYIN
jgi:23S rRNA (adenine2503-C2)-methyltransferase